MKNALFPAIILIAALAIAGCAQDPTVRVDIAVYDDQGQPADGAYVNAYSSYNLGTGTEKWTNINGSISATGTTKDGRVTLQILPGNYAFTASTNDGANGGAEKLIIQKNDSVYITIQKQKPTEFGAKISIFDESGNLVDIQKIKVYYVSTICKINSDEPCTGQRYDPLNVNPIIGNVKDGYSYSMAFQVDCNPQTLKCSDEYEETTLNFNVEGPGTYDFSVTLKKKLKTGSVSLSLVDDATGKLIDVSSQAITMTLTFCPAEKLPDSMFGSPWSKVGNCLTTANSNEEFRVDTNPLSAPLPIGDWNFTFWGSGAGYNSNAAVFTLKENQIVDQNVFLKKKSGAAISAQSVKEYSKANPLEIAKASPSPSASPSPGAS